MGSSCSNSISNYNVNSQQQKTTKKKQLAYTASTVTEHVPHSITTKMPADGAMIPVLTQIVFTNGKKSSCLHHLRGGDHIHELFQLLQKSSGIDMANQTILFSHFPSPYHNLIKHFAVRNGGWDGRQWVVHCSLSQPLSFMLPVPPLVHSNTTPVAPRSPTRSPHRHLARRQST